MCVCVCVCMCVCVVWCVCVCVSVRPKVLVFTVVTLETQSFSVWSQYLLLKSSFWFMVHKILLYDALRIWNISIPLFKILCDTSPSHSCLKCLREINKQTNKQSCAPLVENFQDHSQTNIQRDSKRWTQYRTTIFPELYTVCERSTKHLKEEILRFQTPPLERSPSAKPCSSVSWEQNGYYAAQDFLRSWVH